MNVFFIADTHFDHSNIIEYTGRPFSDVEEMNNTLIANWNAVVAKGDIVYVLGDFAFSRSKGRTDELLSQLNGQKHLIQGNHDHSEVRKAKGWQTVKQGASIVIKGQPIHLSHYPMVSWSKKVHDSWMLYGHCHGSLTRSYDLLGIDWSKLLMLDLGVEKWDYTPVSVDQVAKAMAELRSKMSVLKWRNVKNNIPKKACWNGFLYWINGRNSDLGVFFREKDGFVISRHKFGSNFCDIEKHYDDGHPHGTVKPFQVLERCSIDVDNDQALLGYLKRASNRFDTSQFEGLSDAWMGFEKGYIGSKSSFDNPDDVDRFAALTGHYPKDEDVEDIHFIAQAKIPQVLERRAIGVEVDDDFYGLDKDKLASVKAYLARLDALGE